MSSIIETAPSNQLDADLVSPTVRSSGELVSSTQLLKKLLYLIDVHRLYHVSINARLARTAQVLLLSVSRDGHQQRVLLMFLRAKTSGDFVAIHARQSDVQQYGSGVKVVRAIQRGGAVEGDLQLVTDTAEESAEGFSSVGVVVHYKHSLLLESCRTPWNCGA
jgi:hypothetical protein